jgi:hypothetical protein
MQHVRDKGRMLELLGLVPVGHTVTPGSDARVFSV